MTGHPLRPEAPAAPAAGASAALEARITALEITMARRMAELEQRADADVTGVLGELATALEAAAGILRDHTARLAALEADRDWGGPPAPVMPFHRGDGRPYGPGRGAS